MSNRTLESDFGAVIAELSRQPLSNLFRFKSRVLGAMIDATKLRRHGWKLVDTGNPESCRWRNSLWFDRPLRVGKESYLARMSTSQSVCFNPREKVFSKPMPEKEEKEVLSGNETVRVYVRSVRFHRVGENGLRRTELTGDVPKPVLEPVETDISECTLRNWKSLASDIEYQTKGLSTTLPPRVFQTSFTEAAGILDSLLLKQEQGGYLFSAERLLVRFVRAAVDPDWNADDRDMVENYPDGRSLWNFVHFWFADAPRDGAAMRFLSYALGRAGRISEPYTEIGWSGISRLLGSLGFRREAVLAADRALDCPGADDSDVRFFWASIIAYTRQRFPGNDPEDKPVDVAWLIRLFYEREAELLDMDGYWTLLGLLLAVNGNDRNVALSEIEKESVGRKQEDIPVRVECPWLSWELEEAGELVARWRQVARQREWQALEIVRSGRSVWIRRALSAFPDSAFAKDWGPDMIRRHVIPGMTGECSPAIPAHSGKPNVVAAAWELFPYLDKGRGEIRFRMEGVKSSLTAMSATFATDCKELRRGMPVPAYVYALARSISRCERKNGENGNADLFRMSPGMFHRSLKDTEAIYLSVARVVSVRKAKTSAGDECFCLGMDVGKDLPFTLPVYMRENKVDGEPAKPGDLLFCTIFLQVRFFSPDARSRQWVDSHPDGPGPEPGADEKERRRGHPVTFRKRSWRGSFSIRVPGEGPDSCIQIKDPSPTLESFDAVEAAFRRLRDSFGCEEVVRWNPNPEGIALSARVHGLVLRYRVEKRIGKDRLHVVEGWNPSRIQTLTVRLLDSGLGCNLEYEGFPLLEPPEHSDKSVFFCLDASARSLEYLLEEGKTGALDYDGRNVVEMAACCGAPFLDRALAKLERLGEDVNAMAHEEDEDGLCAVDHHETERRIVEIFRKHGVDNRNDLPEKSNLVE